MHWIDIVIDMGLFIIGYAIGSFEIFRAVKRKFDKD